MGEPKALFDARSLSKFAAEMQASTGDDLGPMIWRDVQRLCLLVEAHREEFLAECERTNIPAEECLQDFEQEALDGG